MQSIHLPVGTCATLACLLEVSAPKPGNVHRYADFEDTTFADYAISAAVSGPILAQAPRLGVGAAILRAVEATRRAVGRNTNLGMLLLLAPLAAVPAQESLGEGLPQVLDRLDSKQTVLYYQAIRTAAPGGLGTVDQADISVAKPGRSVCQVMALAADRDRIARQYVTRFTDIFETVAPWIEAELGKGHRLSETIGRASVWLLAQWPDSLIARKCGRTIAEEASCRAQNVLQSGEPDGPAYARAFADLDVWLRADGHRRNPGTTADLIAAGLYVLLREERIDWPIRF